MLTQRFETGEDDRLRAKRAMEHLGGGPIRVDDRGHGAAGNRFSPVMGVGGGARGFGSAQCQVELTLALGKNESLRLSFVEGKRQQTGGHLLAGLVGDLSGGFPPTARTVTVGSRSCVKSCPAGTGAPSLCM